MKISDLKVKFSEKLARAKEELRKLTLPYEDGEFEDYLEACREVCEGCIFKEKPKLCCVCPVYVNSKLFGKVIIETKVLNEEVVDEIIELIKERDFGYEVISQGRWIEGEDQKTGDHL